MKMFTNKDLRNLIIPLFIEQLLVMLVGLADTFIVSFAGEAAVSGVSLVNSFNTVFIFLFTALASGGAVIISQYIGGKDHKNACFTSSQLLMISTVVSIAMSILILVFATQILALLFGKVEQDVMESCLIYLRISVYSYPAIAIYNAGAAHCRSIGKTNVTMYISTLANVINVVGNCIGVFILRQGVAGVAYPSLLSRCISAILVVLYCMSKKNEVHYNWREVINWNASLVKKILGIAIPNGIENGVHQLVKVALSSLVALFGTYQIAANGVAQSIWSLAALMGLAMAPVYTTVIGQCMGARDVEAANFYFRKLNRITFILSVAWNALVFVFTPAILMFFQISAEAKELVIWMVLINNIFNGLFYPFAGPLGNGLRATGDVKFTMSVSVVLTVVARLLFSILLGVYLELGAIGVTIGMSLDLLIRGIIFIIRYKSQVWTRYKLI